jgi:hypothetical protein
LYRETENPIHAWEGWRLSRKNELPIPEWVAEYFDTCSTAIDDIARKIGPPPTLSKLAGKSPLARANKVDIPVAIAAGFGFSKGHGHRTSFNDWLAANERVLIARSVAEQMAAGESLSAAASEVASKLGISNSTAERAFKSLGDAGPKRVEKLRSLTSEAESGP